MKILAVLPTYRSEDYPEKVGGGEISNRILLEGLASKGHEVTVVTMNAGPHPERCRNGVEIFWPSFFYNKGSIGRIAGIFSYKVLVANLAECCKPDVILTATYGVGISLRVKKRMGIPVGVFIRAFENFKAEGYISESFKALVRKLVYGDVGPSALAEADFLLPNSEFMAGVCRSYVPGVRSNVIYPALGVDTVFPVKKPQNVRNIFMVSSDAHKGFWIFRYLASCFSDLNFHVLGALGNDSGNLKFHGWVNVVETLHREADVLLVPSVCEEAFGRVSLEGLMSGTITLVSDIGGLPETVSHEKTLLVEANNNDAWRRTISSVVADSSGFYLATLKAQMHLNKYFVESQLSELEKSLMISN